MKKCLLVALMLVVPPIPGPAEALPKLAQLTSVSGVSGADDVAAPAAVPGAPVKAQPVQAEGVNSAQPDWSFTPGKLCTPQDPGFVEYRYPERIPYCQRNVTQQMKQQVAAHYGIPQSEWGNYEFDHLLPLAIGGDSHVDNLWPQPKGCGTDCSEGKDKLENDLYLQMKAGTITQAEAVRQIYAWFGKQPQFKKFFPAQFAAAQGAAGASAAAN